MIRVLSVLVICAALVGCGDNRKSASVTGTVTSGGQPVADIIVRFQPVGKGDTSKPEAGMGSYGKTDSQGRFKLLFSDNNSSGAIIGEHVVTIDELTPESEANDDAGGIGKPEKSRVPKKWCDGSARFTVTEGSNTADFDLDS